MEWDLAHRRAAGFVIEILRQPWVYLTLALLATTPHVPIRDIHRILGANRRGSTSYDTLRHRIAALNDDGLLFRHGNDAHAHYDLTRLGGSITGSLEALNAWSLARFGDLTRPGTPPWRRIPRGPLLTPAQRQDAATRAAVLRTIGLLDSQWAFAVLVFSPGDPVTAEELEQRVNDSLADNPDLAPYRRLYQQQRYKAIHLLEAGGLLTHTTERRPGVRPRELYAASPNGLSLLEALLPVGDQNMKWDAELYQIVMRAEQDAAGP